MTAIDLHSRHPTILEQDFLRMDQSRHREAWDIISLSLVLNFVSDGKDRGTSPVGGASSNARITAESTMTATGRMLVRAHTMLRYGGLCFIAVRTFTNYKFT